MKALADCRLYTFVDTAYVRGRAPGDLARALCDGGSDLIQLRAKGEPLETIRRIAEEILPIVRRAGVGLVINDYLGVAKAVGADFCHLGQEDFYDGGYKHVRELNVSSDKPRVGISTHAPAQAESAIAAGAEYVAIGPVFATGTKPSARPVTLEYVRWAEMHVTVPWFAIGGINLRTLDDVLAAGARRICVVSAILEADDVRKRCAEFRDRLG